MVNGSAAIGKGKYSHAWIREQNISYMHIVTGSAKRSFGCCVSCCGPSVLGNHTLTKTNAPIHSNHVANDVHCQMNRAMANAGMAGLLAMVMKLCVTQIQSTVVATLIYSSVIRSKNAWTKARKSSATTDPARTGVKPVTCVLKVRASAKLQTNVTIGRLASIGVTSH